MARPRHAAVVHPRRSTPYLLLATAALVLLPVTPAFAHSEATYCGHSYSGWLHQQRYVIGVWRSGRHIHTVQLTHPFSTTAQYDAISCAT